MGFPPDEPLPFDDKPFPYFLLGDDAFALKTTLMKPYPLRQDGRSLGHERRIFNYRLSRARRIVENAFGIMAARWRVLHTCIQTSANNAELIVRACICLHNLMRMRYPGHQRNIIDVEDENHNLIPGQWREERPLMEDPSGRPPRSDSARAKKNRTYLANYFCSTAGSVPWQNRMVGLLPPQDQ